MMKTAYTLRFTDCRYHRSLAVSGLFDILEDVTMQTAEAQGFGYSAMEKHSLSWIVSDWNSVLYFRPAMGETVHVFSHVQKCGASVLKWQYRVEDATGKTVALAAATWGAANLSLGQAMRIPNAVKECIPTEDTIYFPYAHPGGKVPIDAQKKASFTFFSGEKDFNGHINNVSSILRAIDALPIQDSSITKFSAAYALEANAGMEAQTYLSETAHGFNVYITRETDVISRFYIECEESTC